MQIRNNTKRLDDCTLYMFLVRPAETTIGRTTTWKGFLSSINSGTPSTKTQVILHTVMGVLAGRWGT